MATRRQGAMGKAGKRPVRKGRAGSAGKRRGKGAAGARRARRQDAARELRPDPGAPETTGEPVRPGLRLAEPPRVGPMAPETVPAPEPAGHVEYGAEDELADRQAAELARRIEAKAGAASEDFRRRTEAASGELGRRREEREAGAQEQEDDRELPGYAAIALTLVLGALRLVREIATAPFRIALALLRPRES